MASSLHMTKIQLAFACGLFILISCFISGCDESEGFLSQSESQSDDNSSEDNSTEFYAEDEDELDIAEAGLSRMEEVEEGTEAEEEALAQQLLAAEQTGLGTYADVRPPSCCESGSVETMTWAEFELNHASDNMSQNMPIVIPCGFEVSVTSSPSQTLAGLHVMGHLKFDNTEDVTLTTAFIFVCGKFHIGTEAQSHSANVEIVLAGNVNVTWPQYASDTGELLNFGTAGFITYGGDTVLHGASCGSPSWARLAKTVDAPAPATTSEGDETKVSQSSLGHWRYVAGRGIDGDLKTDFMTKVERRPWWQFELPESVQVGVGIVRVQLPHRSSWWAYTFSGTRSVRSRDIACDVCDGPDEGAIVGISDESCSSSQSGDRCSGIVCGTITTVSTDGRYEIDCKGKTGKYVYVLLPGDSRKLWIAEGSVFSSNVGVSNVELAGNTQASWNAGDRLVITSTNFNALESEEVTISAKIGQAFQTNAVKNKHDGCDPASDANCYVTAEVASITRNIVIRGGADCEKETRLRTHTNRCGHFMIAHTNKAFICGVEFTNLGQAGNEGRYPLHIHMPGTAPSITVKDNALHHNHQRGVVMHGVIGATFESNVCYITNGHCFMLEDGGEENNRIISNIGILPKPLDFGCSHSHDKTFLCPSRSDTSPNAFWIPNTNNYFEGNVGVATNIAYRIETRHVMGLTRRLFPREALLIGRNGKLKGCVPIGSFKNNVAHSSKTGWFNYPRFSPTGGKLVGFLSWRNSIGISVHNSQSTNMPIENARLLDVNLAARGGTGNARVSLVTSQMQGRSDKTSGPFGVKGLHKSAGAIAPVYGSVDAYSRSWARCFGNYRLTDVDRRALAVLKESFKLLEDPAYHMECSAL